MDERIQNIKGDVDKKAESSALQALQEELSTLSETVKGHGIDLPKKAYSDEVTRQIGGAKSELDGKLVALEPRVKGVETTLSSKINLEQAKNVMNGIRNEMDSLYSPRPTIADLSQVSYVLDRIPNVSGTPTLTLIYRASRDGWNRGDFHRLCDGKGPTVSFVRSSKGSLCAGYAKIPWKNSGLS